MPLFYYPILIYSPKILATDQYHYTNILTRILKFHLTLDAPLHMSLRIYILRMVHRGASRQS